MKPIPSTGGRYAADKEGNIYSLVGSTPRKLKPTLRTDGYMRVSVYFENGAKKCMAVHRLVADAFLERKEGKDFVNHINGNKTDNSLSNLEWVTRVENMQHAVATGLHKPGFSRERQLVLSAQEMRRSGMTMAAIAKQIRRSISTVHSYLAHQSAASHGSR